MYFPGMVWIWTLYINMYVYIRGEFKKQEEERDGKEKVDVF